MPGLFYVRYGDAEDRGVYQGDVKMTEVMHNFHKTDIRYKQTLPVVYRGNDTKSDLPYADPSLVVLEVHESETNEKFAKPGYYLLIGITPHQCVTCLNPRK